MKKIDFKNYDTQNTVGVILVVTSFVLFIFLPMFALQSIYGIPGNVESIGREQALLQINAAESMITFSRILSALTFLTGLGFIAIAFRNRRKS